MLVSRISTIRDNKEDLEKYNMKASCLSPAIDCDA